MSFSSPHQELPHAALANCCETPLLSVWFTDALHSRIQNRLFQYSHRKFVACYNKGNPKCFLKENQLPSKRGSNKSYKGQGGCCTHTQSHQDFGAKFQLGIGVGAEMHLASYLGSCQVQINSYGPTALGTSNAEILSLLCGNYLVPQIISSTSILTTRLYSNKDFIFVSIPRKL